MLRALFISERHSTEAFSLHYKNKPKITKSGAVAKELQLMTYKSIRRIIIADDEEIMRNLLADCLASAGYEVFTARNGEQALDVLREHDVDLIITDIVMPETNGLKFIR